MSYNKKLKVLVLSHMYPNLMDHNLGIFIHNQTKHLLKAGCDIKVICPVPYAPRLLWFNPKWKSYGKIPQIDKLDDVPIYYPRYINIPGKRFYKLTSYNFNISMRRSLDSIIKNYQPHVIHAHTATPDGYFALMASEKYPIPFVCSLRGSDINVYPYDDKLIMSRTKMLISNADQLVSVSKALKTEAEKIAKPKNPIKVLYNGCDTIKFSSNSDHRFKFRKQLGILPDCKVLIFVGNIKESKGVFELINAFKKFISKQTNLYLIIVGDGSERQSVEKVIMSGDMRNHVYLAGNRPNKEVAFWLNAADIFILPTHYEGLPNAVLEAMACGLPVIATRVGGIPEVLRDGENGILVNAKDIDALYKAIDYIINNDQMAKKMGRNGRALIEHEFSWDRNASHMIEVYENLISQHDAYS